MLCLAAVQTYDGPIAAVIVGPRVMSLVGCRPVVIVTGTIGGWLCKRGPAYCHRSTVSNASSHGEAQCALMLGILATWQSQAALANRTDEVTHEPPSHVWTAVGRVAARVSTDRTYATAEKPRDESGNRFG